MIPLPNPPRAAPAQGESVLAWAREVQQCLRDIRSAFGSLPDPRPPARPQASAVAAKTYLPFDPILGSDASGNPTVVFWPGSINALLPTNYDAAHALGAEEVVLHWKLACTTDGKQITAATIESSTAPPKPSTPTPNSAAEICEWGFAVSVGSKVMTYHRNFSVIPKEVFRQPVSNPQPFAMNYTPWYVWSEGWFSYE